MKYSFVQSVVRTGVILVTAVVGACATMPQAFYSASTGSDECVVLLHGLNRSWRAMDDMADALWEAGFSTANVDYPSQLGTVEELAPVAVGMGLEKCRIRAPERIHFVTHSMGGILLRYYHMQEPIEELGRVVMLGPPSQGSEVIDKTRDMPGADVFSGPAGRQLGTDEESIPAQLPPADFELGIIAGTGTINPFMSAVLPEADDGKVSVERTKVAGMTDFMTVDEDHHNLVDNDTVIENTLEFLRNGNFSHQESVN